MGFTADALANLNITVTNQITARNVAKNIIDLETKAFRFSNIIYSIQI